MKPAYPTFPASCWWPLRERFKRALPSAVTADYLQSVLEVEPKTARNLVPMLRQMGLVDEGGAVSARANLWRVDEEYPGVCTAIRSELYPASLRDAVPDPSRDFDGAVRWFMKSTGVGTAAAKRMARFYALLSEGNPDAPVERSAPAERRARPTRASAGSRGPAARNGNTSQLRSEIDAAPNGSPTVLSVLQAGASTAEVATTPPQLVIQIQLPASATPEQIDQLVASIARHLAPMMRRA